VSTKLAPGASVQKHINTIRTANERLTSSGLGFEFGDKALAAILMFSLDDSYDPIKMVLSTLKDKDFTFLSVSNAILNEEARRIAASISNTSSSHSSSNEVLYTARPY